VLLTLGYKALHGVAYGALIVRGLGDTFFGLITLFFVFFA
jgi:hypothetical protein